MNNHRPPSRTHTTNPASWCSIVQAMRQHGGSRGRMEPGEIRTCRICQAVARRLGARRRSWPLRPRSGATLHDHWPWRAKRRAHAAIRHRARDNTRDNRGRASSRESDGFPGRRGTDRHSRGLDPFDVDPEARHAFAIGTCNGCHSFDETRTPSNQISPLGVGTTALSPFLRGVTVAEPLTQEPRTYNDMLRRRTDLAVIIERLSRVGAAAFTQYLSRLLRMPPSREARLISIR